ncbi:sugar phosphate isomerase/epimerase [Pseudonocardia sp. DR1-2]|uniref:sugar phosphate isomerase/epimerase family protein n=1 Tax=Pseudonocardia sp. DR1-2 TaxID=2951168 RepID=UPI002042FB07|nr:TIM barrel protein [Pseudonocardia sp. DR1-2]MCM3847830.1 sugar phosphate isomerase/epimerase [Pseudonocardia sp. DR1-2]
MLLLGLASVTFRERSVPDVVRLAVDAGSEVVEWAGDRHVRPGDRSAASAARGACAGAGLRIGTYGSYHKAGASDPGEFDAVVATAAELGAPRVRVWAGTAASADVSPAGRAATVDALRRCADAVAERGMGLLVEHHVESLTDGLDTALRLRAEVGHPALVTHWQPRELPDTDVCLAEVRALRPATVHAFSWGADGYTERLPLGDRADLWAPVLAELTAQSRDDGTDTEVLLEFVPGDTAASLRRDAAALRDLRAGRDLAGAR